MKIIHTSIRLNKLIFNLIKSHAFIVLSLVGNLFIFIVSAIFYWLEAQSNPLINKLFDAVWWGYCTATTVGYGDIVPVTNSGKVLGIILMLAGAALFATFTALFAQTIIEDEFYQLGSKKRKISEIKSVEQLEELKASIEKQINRLAKHR